VMFISNNIKIVGCLAMLFGVSPLFAYGIVGFGAAAYSPAKYGILTEYLPPEKLVVANSWMEGLTVLAIILGAIVGGMLVDSDVAQPLLHLWDVPYIDTGIDTAPQLAIAIISGIYGLAALFNLYIPRVAADHKPLSRAPMFLLKDFWHSFWLLWRDPLGQVSLAVTSLFWGAGSALRLLVLAWATYALGYDTSSGANLTAAVAVGIAIGAVLAARFVTLDHAVKVLPMGIGMGLLVLVMIPVTSPLFAVLLLLSIGMMAGYFVVPMNALLQHRGHLLMGSGSSIAVQNFNENISIFLLVGLYALMDIFGWHLYIIIMVFGLLLAGFMAALYRRHGHDQDSGQT
jgi:MFS transporter, LPLT family, lysophospholipid transporter